MKKLVSYLLFGCTFFNNCCQKSENFTSNSRSILLLEKGITNEKGMTIQSRFIPPDGFIRQSVDRNTFAYYLRNLPLKPHGAKVKYFNGNVKNIPVYEAVINMDISDRDLQQCADAIMRLRGEYFYTIKAYDQISFTLTNGFRMDYNEWIKGNRVIVKGNHTEWQKVTAPSNTYKDFREYMEFVFIYAGTISLSKSLRSKDIQKISIGDVLIVGGSPGHAVIVVDIVENMNGEKMCMLAQSYMPAQETQILKNNKSPHSPWYNLSAFDKIYTPEWTFEKHDLKTW